MLETCDTVEEARAALARIPVHAPQNLTLLDRAGAFLTAFVGPGREAEFRAVAATTNHQGRVEWPEYARAIRTVEREERVLALLADPGMTRERFVAAFLEEPLRNTAYAQGFGTLYTAAYYPDERPRGVPLAGLHVAALARGLHRVRARGDVRGGAPGGLSLGPPPRRRRGQARRSAMPVSASCTMRSATSAAASAVPSAVGMTSTTSTPARSSAAATVRTESSRSTGVMPPGSGVPVPSGMKPGSSTSTSTVRYTGPPPRPRSPAP